VADRIYTAGFLRELMCVVDWWSRIKLPVIIMLFLLSVATLFVSVTANGLPGPPVPDPAHPKPFWSWDTIPLAFHGANRTGEFNDVEIAILAE
jgi:hypothetical protein